MFDIGFSELIVIGIVALVVIGPEKLPRVARTLGHLLGRAQRYVNDVKADINREMHLEELKKLQSEVVDSARSVESSVRAEIDAAQSVFAEPARAAVAELEATARLAESGGETPEATPEALAEAPVATQAEPVAVVQPEPHVAAPVTQDKSAA